jgi:hypothetical protein
LFSTTSVATSAAPMSSRLVDDPTVLASSCDVDDVQQEISRPDPLERS